MPYEVEFTDEFESWWSGLTQAEQESVNFVVSHLQDKGFHLTRPQVDAVQGSKFKNMRELRCQHQGRPYRVLFAFDLRRVAILLLGGDKTGRPDWYEEFVPRADKIYAQHLKNISGGGD
jgi:hypothetical protein